ncbi:MAG: hypothetical protein AABZ55_00925, partial [Bdellovibrionota bacterium]
MKFNIGFILIVLVISNLSFGAEPQVLQAPSQNKLTLSAIEGANTISTHIRKGDKWSPAVALSVGSIIPAGRRIRITPGSKATLNYENGNQLELFNGADLEITGTPRGPEGEPDIIVLYEGLVRGTINSLKGRNAIPSLSGKNPIRLVIRSPAIVLGVRGTVFDISYTAAYHMAKVQTFSGAVEVARDQSTLLSHGGFEIPAGQFVTITTAGISTVQTLAVAPGTLPKPAPLRPLFGVAGLREWLPKPHLFDFEIGLLGSEDPRIVLSPFGINGSVDPQFRPMPYLSWKPGLGLPKLDDIRVKFNLGFAKRAEYFIRELGVSVSAQLFEVAFAEVGVGDQV